VLVQENSPPLRTFRSTSRATNAIKLNSYLLGYFKHGPIFDNILKDIYGLQAFFNVARSTMARRCDISGVTHQNGNRVSHANNKTHHKFESNLQSKRLFVPELGRTVRIRVSTRILRTIDKLGFTGALKKFNLTVADVTK
jgi:large subunit ribosomal protein L28